MMDSRSSLGPDHQRLPSHHSIALAWYKCQAGCNLGADADAEIPGEQVGGGT